MQSYKEYVGMNLLFYWTLMSIFLVATNGTAQERPQVARILFESNRTIGKNTDIFIMDADGANKDRLTDNPLHDISPAWSPDGTRFAMSSIPHGWWENIFVLNVDDRAVDRIQLTVGFRGLTPSWSPNGNWIACVYSTPDDNWNYDVWILRLRNGRRMGPYRFEELGDGDGINSLRLTKHRSQDESPSWSPDGRRIAWSSNRTGNYDIFVMDRDGGNKKNLTNHPKEDKDPEWQPPWGERIAFASDRDGDSEIYLMDTNGGNVKQLTKNVFVWDGHPTWSPSGKKIAFSTNRDRNNEIYVMNSDGNNPVNLTNHPAKEKNPAWFDPMIAYSVSASPKVKRTVTWGEIKQSGLKRAEKYRPRNKESVLLNP